MQYGSGREKGLKKKEREKNKEEGREGEIRGNEGRKIIRKVIKVKSKNIKKGNAEG